MSIVALLPVLLFVALLSGALGFPASPDCVILIDILKELNMTLPVGANGDCCVLRGVTCTGTGNLTSLRWLDLSSNKLSGSIPASIGNLTSLRWLDLSSNELSGSIPASIGDLTRLEYLVLSSNELSGSIPASIGALTSLGKLSLSSNKLSGSIPASIGNLTSLGELDLSSNELSGSIPASIGNLTSLRWLDLSSNKLSGSIPASIGNLTSLKILSLYSNKLSGSIPASIGNLGALTSLNILSLSSNELSGSIPASIGNLTSLRWLDLSSNELSGSIPASIGDLTMLEYLVLSSNELSGSIPASIGNLTRLVGLDLSSNELSGSIPASIGNLTSLNYLYLSSNKLSGSIPASIGDLTSLTHLDLSSNGFSGNVSASALPSSLHYLGLSGNLPLVNMSLWQSSFPDLRTIILRGAFVELLVPPSLGLPLVTDLIISESRISSLQLHWDHGDFENQLDRWMSSADSFWDPFFNKTANYYGSYARVAACMACSISAQLLLRPPSIAAIVTSLRGDQLFPNLRALNLSGSGFVGEMAFSLTTHVLLGATEKQCSAHCNKIPPPEIRDGKDPTLARRFSAAVSGGLSGEGLLALMDMAVAAGVAFPSDGQFRTLRHVFVPGLQVLDVSSNALTGQLSDPSALTSVTALTEVNVAGNRLSGALPWAQLASAPVLMSLDLSSNTFEGDVLPLESGQGFWPRLKKLKLSGNPALRVNASTWKLAVATLEDVSMRNMTELRGPMAADFWSTSAKRVDLSLNPSLTGVLPSSLWPKWLRGEKEEHFVLDVRNCSFLGMERIHGGIAGLPGAELYLGGNEWLTDPEWVDRGVDNDTSGAGGVVVWRAAACVPRFRVIDSSCSNVRDARDVIHRPAAWECGVGVTGLYPIDPFTRNTTLCDDSLEVYPCWDMQLRELRVLRDSSVALSLNACRKDVCSSDNASLVVVPEGCTSMSDDVQCVCGQGKWIRRLVRGSGCTFVGDFRYRLEDAFPVVGTLGLRTGVCVSLPDESFQLVAMLRVLAASGSHKVTIDFVEPLPIAPGPLPERIRVLFTNEDGLSVDVRRNIRLEVAHEGFTTRQVTYVPGPQAEFDVSSVKVAPAATVVFSISVETADGALFTKILEETHEVGLCMPMQKTYFNETAMRCQLSCALESKCSADSACPIGAVCNGTGMVCAAAGWWRSGGVCLSASHDVSAEALLTLDKCVAQGCTGFGNGSSSTDGCADGYAGPLCGSCREFNGSDFVLKEGLACARCPSLHVSVLVICAFLLSAALWVGVVVLTQTRSAYVVTELQEDSGEVYGELSMYLKLLLTVVQTSVVMDRLDVDWSGPVRVLQESMGSVISLFDMVWIRCVFPGFRPLATRLFWMGGTFLGLFVLLNVSLVTLWVKKKGNATFHARNGRWLLRKSTIFVVLSVGLFAIYNQIVLLVAYSFVGVAVTSTVNGTGTENYLLMDVDVRVDPWTPEAVTMRRMAYATGALCVLGYPLALMIWVVVLQRWLGTCFVVRAVMGLYTAGYRDGVVWFEFARLARTSLSLLTSSFSEPSFQVGVVCVLLLLEQVATLVLRPYQGSAQGLQVLTLTVQMMQFIIVGTILSTLSVDESALVGIEAQFRSIASVILVILDSVVMFAFVYEIGTSLLLLLERSGRLLCVVQPLLRVLAWIKAAALAGVGRLGLRRSAATATDKLSGGRGGGAGERSLCANERAEVEDSLRREIADLKTSNAQLKTSNAELKTSNAELKTSNAELTTEVADLKGIKVGLQGHLRRMYWRLQAILGDMERTAPFVHRVRTILPLSKRIAFVD